MIELRNVTRTYGRKVAVDRLSLHVPRGELFGFLGPNGAGKTTTIKMMVGLLRPTSGTVRIAGHDIATSTREANLMTGYVPDEPYLYDKLTGREFLRFVADLYGMPARDGADSIEQQIAAFELAEFVDHLTESYSHGMKQRLVFASALLHRPDVLIVDEPMVGLDPRSMRMTKDLLKDRVRAGTTVFMSTHSLSVAEEIADRIGVITTGTVRFLGTVSELRRQLARDDSLEQLFLTLTDESPTDRWGGVAAPTHVPS
jgi:ABC-2 type transport system ATP-binding protein